MLTRQGTSPPPNSDLGSGARFIEGDYSTLDDWVWYARMTLGTKQQDRARQGLLAVTMTSQGHRTSCKGTECSKTAVVDGTYHCVRKLSEREIFKLSPHFTRSVFFIHHSSIT